MDDMLNKVKQTAEKALNGAEKITKNAIYKTKVVIDQTKYKFSSQEIETKVKDILSQLGAHIYQEYKNGAEFDEDISLKCEQLDNFYDELMEIRNKIAELKNTVVCKNCGSLIDENSAFCPKCGVKTE